MKSLIPFALLAAAALAGTVHAQSLVSQQASQVDSTSGAINSGVNVNSYSSPFSVGTMDYGFRTNQSASAMTALATPAVWRCATSGTGLAVQIVGGGLNYSGKGGESTVCGVDFRIGINQAIDKLPEGDAKTVAIRLACGDEALADAWEGTAKQCDDQTEASTRRKARWAAAKPQKPVALLP